MAKTITASLGGGDAVTADTDLIFKVYGDLDGYITPIDTFGSHVTDADVTVSGGNVVITNVAEGSNTSLRITSEDEAGNESVKSAAYSIVSGVDADYQAFIDQVTTDGAALPSAGQQLIAEQLVIDLKAAGVWAKLDRMFLYANDGSEGYALRSVKNPTTSDLAAKVGAVVTWASNTGFQNQNGASYVNTNYNPTADGVNFLQDSAFVMIYNPIIEADSSLYIRTTDSLVKLMDDNQATNNYLNGSANSANFQNLIAGANIINRINASQLRIYNDSNDITTNAASSALCNANLHAPFSGANPLYILLAGGALSDAEMAAANTAVKTYIANL